MGSELTKQQVNNISKSTILSLDNFETFAKDAYLKLKDLNGDLIKKESRLEEDQVYITKLNEIEQQLKNHFKNFDEITKRITTFNEEHKTSQEKLQHDIDEMKNSVHKGLNHQQSLNDECKILMEAKYDHQQELLSDLKENLGNSNIRIGDILTKVDTIEKKVFGIIKSNEEMNEQSRLLRHELNQAEDKYEKLRMDIDNEKNENRRDGYDNGNHYNDDDIIIEKLRKDIMDIQKKVPILMRKFNKYIKTPKLKRNAIKKKCSIVKNECENNQKQLHMNPKLKKKLMRLYKLKKNPSRNDKN